jgi:VanZ family protein
VLRVALWAGWGVAIGVVAIASLTPQAAPPAAFHIDKVTHFAAYALLAALPGALVRRVPAAILICLLLAAMGIAIEVAQSHLPGRFGSGADAAMNLIGISTGWLIGRRWRHLLPGS